MTTAREKLLQAIQNLLEESYEKDKEVLLKRLLNSYRVQLKPEEILDKVITARDELANRLINAWENGLNFNRKEILKVFLPFRMQLKQGLKNAKLKLKKNLENEDLTSERVERQNNKTILRKGQENVFFRKKSTTEKKPLPDIPIGGGPKKKTKTQGLCPKCRSNGLALAPGNFEEGHYACVYCGYHAFFNSKNPELDLPLAAQILGDD